MRSGLVTVPVMETDWAPGTRNAAKTKIAAGTNR
jgi:hypothetical protein